MENHLEPIYEAFDKLHKAKENQDHEQVLLIEKEIDALRKQAVEDSKRKGSMGFHGSKFTLNIKL